MKLNHLLIRLALCLLLPAAVAPARGQAPVAAGVAPPAPPELAQDNIIWTAPSKNAGESMPCGGGDIGLNVWVENGDLYCYLSRSGTFDENNAFLKLGRIRIRLSPNPLKGLTFRQELVLEDGHVRVSASDGNVQATLNVWVDVYRPAVHVDITSSKAIRAEADYESWRYRERAMTEPEDNANSYKFDPPFEVHTFRDSIQFAGKGVLFFHRNRDEPSAFDQTVREQGLDAVRSKLFNPLYELTFGGLMEGAGMEPGGTYKGRYANTDFEGWRLKSKGAERSHEITLYFHTAQTPTLDEWQRGLEQVAYDAKQKTKTAWQATRAWWEDYWKRSYIFIQPDVATDASRVADAARGQGAADALRDQLPEWQAGRNYQLFRYMLGCNAYGSYPTKFNGGLFTVDPVFTDSTLRFTPDYRKWGGGTMTAQNQRLVYYPMLKSGDFDMMKSEFDFYLRSQHNAELRSRVYWGHGGAAFTEQLENFGLPNYAEYGRKRPEGYDKGMEYNAWLEYTWDSVLEFCFMMLETERYDDTDISAYVPFIESCLTFFNEHYQYLARNRGRKTFDGNGRLVLYPGSAGETYKMAYNSTSTIAALQTVLRRLLELPGHYLTRAERQQWETMLERLPSISFRSFDGHPTIAPAQTWERVNNTESPQLYPVFPWGIYGIGKPGLDTAINTWKYDTNVVKFRSFVGWKQDNIFAARLGLTSDAAKLTVSKLENGSRRFPAFWGPGFDWAPDHNWGGSGMIGLQEMLLQTDGKTIYLFPAWPDTWDVHFKLHAPYGTTIEARMVRGKPEILSVVPEERRKDIIVK